MIVEQAEVLLVDCAAKELQCERVAGSPMLERLRLFCQPQKIVRIDVAGKADWSSFARVDDNAFIFRSYDGTEPGPILACKVVILGSEAVVWSGWIADEIRFHIWYGSYCSSTELSRIFVAF